jgi:uncharacterized UPF0160 family protein
MAKRILIVTHNGKFHADESLAVAILKRLPFYKVAEVIRTRDPNVINTADIVVDVGGIYDPNTHRYDHHQPSFHDTFSELHKTRLSSAGLVYKHFGRQLLRQSLPSDSQETLTNTLFKKIYEKFIEPFDGIDNGIERYENPGEQRYSKPLDIFDMVNDLNPDWNGTEQNQDAQFQKAVELVGHHLDKTIEFYCNAWIPARSLVCNALLAAKESNSRYIVLETNCPWKEHLCDLEAENDLIGHFLYAVYPDVTSGTFRVQAVPSKDGSFESRKALAQNWRGLRDEELSSAAEIPGCTFVHVTGFIGGNKTKEGAVQMAIKSIQQ